MSWQNYIETFREASSYKKRIRRYISDRNKMLGKGGQKNTPPQGEESRLNPVKIDG